ncbi:hypothetical protein M413DRAFT_446253 [Hebeloma cylindrosporum]|uniref:Phosphatidate cytidylyltransferase n=1 Tax=Hebeloma cylindrosporum TaxID=76867 RepID=A0A0C3BTY1_HEBCY|nr:hypothetical protein M413DRAFT_446253 [Hebeloma cylindrosporum h7]
MSRFNGAATRTIFASKTTFDALEVDFGEETESEEERLSELDADQDSILQEPVKLTKSAIKRANLQARLERRQREKVSKTQTPTKAKIQTVTPPISPPISPSKPETTALHEPVPFSETSDQVPDPFSNTLVEEKANGKGQTVESTSVASQNVIAPVETEGFVSPVDQAPKINPETPVEPLPLPDASPRTTDRPPNGPPPTQDPEKVKKRQNALTRILWTFIMIGGFIALLLLGHAYMVLLVMLCQTLVDAEPLKSRDPWSKTLNWYFFAVTNYFLYGESIIYYFKHVVFADANLLPFVTNHRMISFTLYTIGFMGFVMSLKKGYLKQQFGLFCWVHMSLLLNVVSSHFIVNNILEGLIWFWVPASLVICNDCFAYIWGVTVGRTPLIKLSPKKTVEGFVGAFISTVIFAVFWGTYFMRFDYMICPVHDLGVSAFSSTECTPNPIFVWRTIELWKPLSICLTTLASHSVNTISYAPYQLHLLTLACFASLVAPFGGFFASGFKRAFNIKDFGHSIPGHGGMTDRMDCQFLMGIFTYVYYSSLIRVHHVTVGGILQTAVSGLTVEQQLELIRDLTRYLGKQGISVS